MEQPLIKVDRVATKSVMTKSNTPLGGYSVNPYVGCPHACNLQVIRLCHCPFPFHSGGQQLMQANRGIALQYQIQDMRQILSDPYDLLH